MRKGFFLPMLLLALFGLSPGMARAVDIVDGVYQIGTAADFREFGAAVNGGTVGANAVLTADIDFSGVSNYTPVGTVDNPYAGTFDGQGHRIMNLTYSGGDYSALFGVANGGAVFKNFVVDKSCKISGGAFVAGVVASSSSSGSGVIYFQSVGNEADITGMAQNVAGIIGVSMGGTCTFTMTNCYNAGNITGSIECAAFSGYLAGSGSKLTNCWNSGRVSGVDGSNKLFRGGADTKNVYDIDGVQGTMFSAEEAASGALAYRFNAVDEANPAWFQNIDNGSAPDAFPTFNSAHGKVYVKGRLKCDGTPYEDATYTNTESTGERDAHSFVDGFCENCGTADLNFVPRNDSVFQIATAEQLNWFAKYVNSLAGEKTYAELTADIDFTAFTQEGVIIGLGGHDFTGWFDGKGHTVVVEYPASLNQQYVALFRYVKVGTIRNLVVEGNINTAQKYGAGIAAYLVGTDSRIENCVSKVNIISTVDGDATNGGIVAVTNGCSVYNSAFIGNLEGMTTCGNGGIIGYTEGGTIVENCFVYAGFRTNLETTTTLSNIFVRNGSTSNCFYGNPDGGNLPLGTGTLLTDEQVENGEAAFMLNGRSSENPVWFQNLDNGSADATPVPFSTHGVVYAAGRLHCNGDAYIGESAFSNTAGSSVRDDHNFVDGVCSYCHTLQPDFMTPVDSVYEVSTPGQLNWVAWHVNSAENGTKTYVRLTSDIDFTQYSREGTMIGIDAHNFSGWFDGQGHKVTIEYDTDQAFVSLFSYVSEAQIKNLEVEGTVTTSAKCATGLAVELLNNSTIENCISCVTVTVTGDYDNKPAAGFSIHLGGGSKIVNSAFLGEIISSSYGNGGVASWVPGDAGIENVYVKATLNYPAAPEGAMASSVLGRGPGAHTNCYYDVADASTSSVPESGAVAVTDLQVANGELAYLLNGSKSENAVWHQNLDNGEEVDAAPVPFSTHGAVYLAGHLHCNETPYPDGGGYSNIEGNFNIDEHDFVDGVCTYCKTLQAGYLAQGEDGFYEISTPEQLNWFALNVNSGNSKINAKLAADIDFSKYTADSLMIGVNSAYGGVFDGQGHTITILYNLNRTNVGLFRALSGATVRNLRVSGTINGNNYIVGGLSSSTGYNTLVENCLVDVTFNNDRDGDSSIGGFSGDIQDHSVFRNCAFVGTINAPLGIGNGGIVAYANSAASTVIENCYVSCQATVAGNSTTFARNSPTLKDCYYTDNPALDVEVNTTEVSDDQMKSGELAFTLNGYKSGSGPWTQTVGTDDYPVPFGSNFVYATGTLKCDGTPDAVSYSNTRGELAIAQHSYDENGICQSCGEVLISNGQQLLNFADNLNNSFVSDDVNVKFANDIDMAGIEGFQGIGSESVPFKGKFDGQGFRIKNLAINGLATDYHGLFACVGGDAEIRNVVIDSTCTIKGRSFIGGIAGASQGRGLVILENCGNEAFITGTEVNVAGIIGVNMGSGAAFRITNCYNTGVILGARESAALSGWLGSNAEVVSCFNIGKISGVDGVQTFYRGSAILTNSFEEASVGKQTENVATVTAEQVRSGALCYMLNDSVSGAEGPYYQTIGTDLFPVLSPNSGKVFAVNGVFTNDVVGINSAKTDRDGDVIVRIYTIDGMQIPALQKGINIVRYKNGVTKKVMVK